MPEIRLFVPDDETADNIHRALENMLAVGERSGVTVTEATVDMRDGTSVGLTDDERLVNIETIDFAIRIGDLLRGLPGATGLSPQVIATITRIRGKLRAQLGA